jgi:hypothetical protein
VKRPTKKEIADAVDKLKDKTSGAVDPDSRTQVGKLTGKKDSKRIRKQGV